MIRKKRKYTEEKLETMQKKLPPLEVVEISGEQYPDKDVAIRAALPSIADDVAATIRRLVADVYFIVKDGKVIRNPERTKKNEKEDAA